jgi:cell division septal protein FtsQ
VTERAPFAVARSGAKSAIVDRDLRVLQTVPSAGQTALPVFVLPPSSALIPGAFLTQAPAIALRDDYDAMIAANVIPLSVRLDKYGGVIATVRGGIEILFGDGEGADFAKKLALVDPILAQVVHKERRVAAVDLRAAGTPVVVYR